MAFTSLVLGPRERTERFRKPTEVDRERRGPAPCLQPRVRLCSSPEGTPKISENVQRAVWRSSQPAARSAAIVGRQPAACSWARARLASSGGFGGRTRNRGLRHQLRQQFPGLVEMADPHKTHHAIGMGATKGWCLAEAFLLFIQSLLVALIAPQDHGVEEAVISWPDWIEPNRLVGQLQRLRNLTRLRTAPPQGTGGHRHRSAQARRRGVRRQPLARDRRRRSRPGSAPDGPMRDWSRARWRD